MCSIIFVLKRSFSLVEIPAGFCYCCSEVMRSIAIPSLYPNVIYLAKYLQTYCFNSFLLIMNLNCIILLKFIYLLESGTLDWTQGLCTDLHHKTSCIFPDRISLSCLVAQVGSKLKFSCLSLPEWWDHRPAPPGPVYPGFFKIYFFSDLVLNSEIFSSIHPLKFFKFLSPL